MKKWIVNALRDLPFPKHIQKKVVNLEVGRNYILVPSGNSFLSRSRRLPIFHPKREFSLRLEDVSVLSPKHVETDPVIEHLLKVYLKIKPKLIDPLMLKWIRVTNRTLDEIVEEFYPELKNSSEGKAEILRAKLLSTTEPSESYAFFSWFGEEFYG